MIPDLNDAEMIALRQLIADRISSGSPKNEPVEVTRPGPASGSGSGTVDPPQVGSRQPFGMPKIPRLAIIKITSAATGGGYYNGTAYAPGATMTVSTTDLSTTKLEGRSIGTVIVVNFAEVSTSTHTLTHASNTLQKYFMGVQIGRSGNYPLYALIGNAFWTKACT